MGGHAAKVARDDIEKNLGRTVISNENSLNYKYLNRENLDATKSKQRKKIKGKKENS